MQQLTTPLLILAFFFSYIPTAYASPIKIVTEEYPPYNYTHKGEITGVGTEVVRATLSELGLETPIHSYPWARAYKVASQEKNVLIYTISRTPEREQAFKWVGVIAPVDQCVFALHKRKDIVINSFADLEKYTIGTVNNDVQEQYLISKRFPRAKIQSNTSHEANFRKLLKGRIDLWTALELTSYHLVREAGLSPQRTIRKVYCMKDLSVEGDYMAFSKSTSDQTVDAFRTALQAIKDKGIYDKIVTSYLDNN